MYAYIIDTWVRQKYRREMDKIDLLLTQHGLQGRKIQMGRLTDLASDLAAAASTGVSGFIAVGDDATVSRMLNTLIRLAFDKKAKIGARGTALGVLPVGKDRAIAELFAVHTLPAAVLALAKQKTKLIDLGCVNDRHYFITAALFPARSALDFGSYRISSLHEDHIIGVCNANIFKQDNQESALFNMQDGQLEAVVAFRPQNGLLAGSSEYILESVFSIEEITVRAKTKTVSVKADAEKKMSAPAKITVAPGAIKFITHG